ncbi:hypothetical protein HPGCJGGD_2178 [Methylobacterium haplocladii]|nr:hypothetical protein HPGCJGGD_2178 [Methylobacterium haplocladii]
MRDRRLAGFKFVRQEKIGRYFADFICRDAKLIVEADGSQHAESVRDRIRDQWLVSQGYRILRFWNAEIMNNTTGVLDTILAALHPSPRGRGEGRNDLVVGAASPQGEGEGVSPKEALSDAPPHPRFGFASAGHGPDEGSVTLSPHAGRGEARA